MPADCRVSPELDMTRHDDEDESDDLDDRDDPLESDMDDHDEPELVTCPHCGKYVSEEAERCHRCGQYIVEGRSRPKWAVATVVVLLVLGALSIYYLGRIL
jgi:hypothetical protein